MSKTSKNAQANAANLTEKTKRVRKPAAKKEIAAPATVVETVEVITAPEAIVEPVAEPVVEIIEAVYAIEPTGDEEVPVETGPSLLAGLLGNMTGEVKVEAPVQAAAKPMPEKIGLAIEKDRPMQNGVKARSKGGLCRAVWDACDDHTTATGTAPTAKEVKVMAAEHGWNANNASIEYYQWRKFHGISGRVVKPAPVAAEPAPIAFGQPVTMPMVSPVAFN